MLYELRRYELFAHNKAAFHGRFKDHTLRFFEKYDFTFIGSWEVEIGDAPEFVYLLSWKDLGARQKAWEKFNADPEWTEIKRATHQEHGQLVAKTHSQILRPTAYSPLS